MASEPVFQMQVIESGLTDGYWIQAVDEAGGWQRHVLHTGETAQEADTGHTGSGTIAIVSLGEPRSAAPRSHGRSAGNGGG